jgi:enoyl-CoA hydratase/carnithine racemase
MLKAAIVERRGPVGWVVIRNVEKLMEESWEVDEYVEIHTAIAMGLDELRFDKEIRLIGITGELDGQWYNVPRRRRFDDDQRHRDRHNFISKDLPPGLHPKGPDRDYPSAIETLAMLEKPVIARVNGDAIGFGQSLLWGCDLIVAIAGAVVSDVHMGQGGVVDSNGEQRGFPYALTPGDGAMAFLPLFLPPTKAKEYQLLSRAWSTDELATLGAINYVVPSYEDLDAKVGEIIDQLLARPQHALAQTKRLFNKKLIEQWNLTMDLAHAYEMLDFYKHNTQGHMEPGWDPYGGEAAAPPAGGWSPTTRAEVAQAV